MDKWLDGPKTDWKSSSENPVLLSRTWKSESVKRWDIKNSLKKQNAIRRYDSEFINVEFPATDVSHELNRLHSVVCLNIFYNSLHRNNSVSGGQQRKRGCSYFISYKTLSISFALIEVCRAQYNIWKVFVL